MAQRKRRAAAAAPAPVEPAVEPAAVEQSADEPAVVEAAVDELAGRGPASGPAGVVPQAAPASPRRRRPVWMVPVGDGRFAPEQYRRR